MIEYVIKIETKSDIIFGNGQSIAGFIDSDIVHDKYGFPYLSGKTFKGKIGEMANLFPEMLKQTGKDSLKFKDSRNRLFGIEGRVTMNSLKFSDCEMSTNLRECYINSIKKTPISKEELLDALTYVDRQTSINYKTGVAEEGSLRNFRVIKRGLNFYCKVTVSNELINEDKILLASSCRLLQHLGSQETKGKGIVETTLWLKEQNVTNQYIELLNKGGGRIE
jgi:CRISPR/Cas system CSM-associated protein Csm3 (group 7 of RAMP superfamily)